MVNRLFNFAFGAIIGQFVQQKIREGSIRAVMAYITVIKSARLALLGLLALGVVGSILVTGLVLMVIGIVGLLPIEAGAASVTLLIIGAVLAILAGVGLGFVFSQKRWLEMSRSYELMDAVLGPWDGMLPPNPVDIMKGHRGSGVSQKRHADRSSEVALRTDEDAHVVHAGDFGTGALTPQMMR